MLILLILLELVSALANSGIELKVKGVPLSLSLSNAVGQEEQFETAAHTNFATWCQATRSTLKDEIAVQQEQLAEAAEAMSSYREAADWLRKGTLKNMSGLNTSLHLMQSQSQLWRSTQMKVVMEMQVNASRRLLAAIDDATVWEQDAFATHKRAWAQLHVTQEIVKKKAPEVAKPTRAVNQVAQEKAGNKSGEKHAGEMLEVDKATGFKATKTETKKKLSRRLDTALKGPAPAVMNVVPHSFMPPPGLLQLQLPTSRFSTDLLGNKTLTPLLTLAGVNPTQALDPVAPSSALSELSSQLGANSDAVAMFTQLPLPEIHRLTQAPEHVPAALQVGVHATPRQKVEVIHHEAELPPPLPSAARTLPSPVVTKTAATPAVKKKLGFLEKKLAQVQLPASFASTAPASEPLQKTAVTTPSPAAAKFSFASITPALESLQEAAVTTASPAVAKFEVPEKLKDTLLPLASHASAVPVSLATKKSADSEMEAFIHEVSSFVEKPLTGDFNGRTQAPSTTTSAASTMALSSDLASLIGLSQGSHVQSVSFLQIAEDIPSQTDSRARLAASALAANLGSCRLVTVVGQQSVHASIQMLSMMKNQLEAQRPHSQCKEDAEAAHKRVMLQLAEKGTQLLEAEHATLLSLLADLRNSQALSARIRAEFVGLLQQTLGHTYEAANADLLATVRSAGPEELQTAASLTALSEQLQADTGKVRGLAAAVVQEGAEFPRLHETLDQKRAVKEQQFQEARAVLAKTKQQVLAARQAAARGKGCSTELLAALSEALHLLQQGA